MSWIAERVATPDRDAVRARLAEGPPPGTRFAPCGAGLALSRGNPPDRPLTLLDLRALDRVVDHAHRELTITVEPGVTLNRLRETLRGRGQWFPAAAGLEREHTVGGMIGAALEGPLAAAGALRDEVLGATFVTGRGEVVTAGSRVVKSVAGYDLMKLLVGALGTFGVLVEVTLRVSPLPARWGGVTVPWSPAPTPRSGTLPEPVARWREQIAGEAAERLLVAGPAPRVRDQVERARRHYGDAASEMEEAEVIEAVKRAGRIASPGRRYLRWGGGDAQKLAAASPGRAAGEERLLDLGRGRFWVQADGPSAEVDGLPIWGEDPPAGGSPGRWLTDPAAPSFLLAELKRALDPEGGLVSGRLPGGV
jgi:hypothetical protein